MKAFWSYWKEVIIISVVCLTLFYVVESHRIAEIEKTELAETYFEHGPNSLNYILLYKELKGKYPLIIEELPYSDSDYNRELWEQIMLNNPNLPFADTLILYYKSHLNRP